MLAQYEEDSKGPLTKPYSFWDFFGFSSSSNDRKASSNRFSFFNLFYKKESKASNSRSSDSLIYFETKDDFPGNGADKQKNETFPKGHRPRK